MSTLFDITPNFPSGFIYLPDFITKEEENKLLAEVSTFELQHFSFQGFKANRKVASFGYDYNFDRGGLTKGKNIPEAFYFIIEKVSKFLNIPSEDFAEFLITEYPPGAVINWHRDAPPFDLIAGISLMADCTFKLRPQNKEQQNRSSIISFPVHRRSLYIIQGVARTGWQHSISPVKSTRFSITLRTMKKL